MTKGKEPSAQLWPFFWKPAPSSMVRRTDDLADGKRAGCMMWIHSCAVFFVLFWLVVFFSQVWRVDDWCKIVCQLYSAVKKRKNTGHNWWNSVIAQWDSRYFPFFRRKSYNLQRAIQDFHIRTISETYCHNHYYMSTFCMNVVYQQLYGFQKKTFPTAAGLYCWPRVLHATTLLRSNLEVGGSQTWWSVAAHSTPPEHTPSHAIPLLSPSMKGIPLL